MRFGITVGIFFFKTLTCLSETRLASWKGRVIGSTDRRFQLFQRVNGLGVVAGMEGKIIGKGRGKGRGKGEGRGKRKGRCVKVKAKVEVKVKVNPSSRGVAYLIYSHPPNRHPLRAETFRCSPYNAQKCV